MELQITQTTHPLSISDEKCSTPVKNEKKINVHKIGGAHLQCVNNHYAEFEYKGLNTVRVSEYTN